MNVVNYESENSLSYKTRFHLVKFITYIKTSGSLALMEDFYIGFIS